MSWQEGKRNTLTEINFIQLWITLQIILLCQGAHRLLSYALKPFGMQNVWPHLHRLRKNKNLGSLWILNLLLYESMCTKSWTTFFFFFKAKKKTQRKSPWWCHALHTHAIIQSAVVLQLTSSSSGSIIGASSDLGERIGDEESLFSHSVRPGVAMLPSVSRKERFNSLMLVWCLTTSAGGSVS